jgi:hypothetical protein
LDIFPPALRTWFRAPFYRARTRTIAVQPYDGKFAAFAVGEVIGVQLTH